jgi:hypothetical protein
MKFRGTLVNDPIYNTLLYTRRHLIFTQSEQKIKMFMILFSLKIVAAEPYFFVFGTQLCTFQVKVLSIM